MQDHPRLRGEYPPVGGIDARSMGSPPLARGVLQNCRCVLCFKRITPACAGSTKRKSVSKPISQDHPRLRGEYQLILLQSIGKLGSPPLARGVQLKPPCKQMNYRITPACAGSTELSLSPLSFSWDHPRLRGEYH